MCCLSRGLSLALMVGVSATLAGTSTGAWAQQGAAQGTMEQQVDRLSSALSRTESKLADSQQELQSLRDQLTALRRQLAAQGTNAPSSDSLPQTAPAEDATVAQRLEDVEERQAMQETQIATHEQAKVESESKFPVKITGMILVNAFTNTQNVDNPATPTFALAGGGSTGISLRQTVLGLDARGPHLFGSQTSADVRVDFAGSSSTSSYSSGLNLLRLRTAHATLRWDTTQAFFALDRPILNPNYPTSLTAVALPALAWSGNLWNWNPQIGITHDLKLDTSRRFRMQAALIDTADPPAYTTSAAAQTTLPSPSGAERSRWPGVETRAALLGGEESKGIEIGLGGYFAPHTTPAGYHGNSWAGTMDYRIPLPAHLQWSGSVYRGQGLGGLGGGAYKDYLYRLEGGESYIRWLDDVGGWTQIKQQVTERLEWNAAFGIDNVFSGELRPYVPTGSSSYLGLARNRTFTGNFIYSPSAYLLFSLEYRQIQSTPVIGPASTSNVIGAAAGYRF